jgi:hypothetical protein
MIIVDVAEDIGCTLKVKCRPVRSDGHKGEIFTSMASTPIAVHRPESNLDLDTGIAAADEEEEEEEHEDNTA